MCNFIIKQYIRYKRTKDYENTKQNAMKRVLKNQFWDSRQISNKVIQNKNFSTTDPNVHWLVLITVQDFDVNKAKFD